MGGSVVCRVVWYSHVLAVLRGAVGGMLTTVPEALMSHAMVWVAVWRVCSDKGGI